MSVRTRASLLARSKKKLLLHPCRYWWLDCSRKFAKKIEKLITSLWVVVKCKQLFLFHSIDVARSTVKILGWVFIKTTSVDVSEHPPTSPTTALLKKNFYSFRSGLIRGGGFQRNRPKVDENGTAQTILSTIFIFCSLGVKRNSLAVRPGPVRSEPNVRRAQHVMITLRFHAGKFQPRYFKQ